MTGLRIGIDVGVSSSSSTQLHRTQWWTHVYTAGAPDALRRRFQLTSTEVRIVYVGMQHLRCAFVQGTATDAVVLNSKHRLPQVLAKAKVPTTPDVLSGISAALQQLQQQSPASFNAVEGVFLGTTQFVNAVVQLQGLAKVFVVRLCGTATHALPPFVGMPAALREAVAAGYLLSAGAR
jgi:hypothetical protein